MKNSIKTKESNVVSWGFGKTSSSLFQPYMAQDVVPSCNIFQRMNEQKNILTTEYVLPKSFL